ncbi:hypothetical protein AAY473_021103, partial [Plecturocebus cupreus]
MRRKEQGTSEENKEKGPGTVAHACNSSTVGGQAAPTDSYGYEINKNPTMIFKISREELRGVTHAVRSELPEVKVVGSAELAVERSACDLMWVFSLPQASCSAYKPGDKKQPGVHGPADCEKQISHGASSSLPGNGGRHSAGEGTARYCRGKISRFNTTRNKGSSSDQGRLCKQGTCSSAEL